MLCIFLTNDALSLKVPQLTLQIARGDCIVKSQNESGENRSLALKEQFSPVSLPKKAAGGRKALRRFVCSLFTAYHRSPDDYP